MILVPIIAGIGLKGIMKKLWAMLNTLQLINALSLMNVSVPANVITVQKESNSIINFQPIDKDLVYGIIFGEQEDGTADDIQSEAPQVGRLLGDEAEGEDPQVEAPFGISNAMLENFEMDTDSILKGMLILGLCLVVAAVLIVVIYVCTKKCMHCCSPKIRKLCLMVKGMLMFNSLLRYFMMTFLSMATGCCLQIYITTQNPTYFRKIEAILSMIILCIFLVMTFFLTRHIMRNQKNLNSPAFKLSYGTLYIPVETRRGKWPLIYIAIFCFRRFLVATITSFLPGYPLI